MAAHATDPGANVHAVVEEGIVRQVVHTDPAQRLVVLHAVLERREQLAVPLDHRVAVHAGLRRRDVGNRRGLDGDVAVTAIETELTHVQLVAVRDGLLGRVTDVGELGGEEIPDACDRQDADCRAGDRQDERGPVRRFGKDLRQAPLASSAVPWRVRHSPENGHGRHESAAPSPVQGREFTEPPKIGQGRHPAVGRAVS